MKSLERLNNCTDARIAYCTGKQILLVSVQDKAVYLLRCLSKMEKNSLGLPLMQDHYAFCLINVAKVKEYNSLNSQVAGTLQITEPILGRHNGGFYLMSCDGAVNWLEALDSGKDMKNFDEEKACQPVEIEVE